jgi:hypothetical protein
MSTVTGTANFAQNNIPTEYLTVATMTIGTISLVAGIITTIQQFLKISEMNESHRVSSISWGKFHRNIKVELAKPPQERTPVNQLIKICKEEFDRLIETSQSIPNHIIALFKETFSGGEIKYDGDGNKIPLTDKQRLFNELVKPEICDSIVSVSRIVYNVPFTASAIIAEKIIDQNAIAAKQVEIQKRGVVDAFIISFEADKKRLPTVDEIRDNTEDTISENLIQAVLSDIEYKKTSNVLYSSSTV